MANSYSSGIKNENSDSADTAFTEYSFKETSLFHSFGTVDNYQTREDAKGVREQYSHYMGGTDKLASWKDREFNPDDTPRREFFGERDSNAVSAELAKDVADGQSFFMGFVICFQKLD